MFMICFYETQVHLFHNENEFDAMVLLYPCQYVFLTSLLNREVSWFKSDYWRENGQSYAKNGNERSFLKGCKPIWAEHPLQYWTQLLWYFSTIFMTALFFPPPQNSFVNKTGLCQKMETVSILPLVVFLCPKCGASDKYKLREGSNKSKVH